MASTYRLLTDAFLDTLEQDLDDRQQDQDLKGASLAQEIQVLRAALNKLQLEWTEVVKSGDGSQTVFQLSHGLGAVPGLAQVQERSSAAAKEFYVSNRTSSYVEITFASAPVSGTDNLVFGLLVGLGE